MHPVDHLIWACPALEAGTEAVAALTGVAPAPGGVHPGGGTRNALLSLGSRCYLEVIAPDPDQDPSGTPAEWMSKLARPGLASWALAATDLRALAARLAAASLRTRGVVAMTRKSADGAVLRWEVLRLAGHAFGPVAPFFIDWLDTPQPGGTLPARCALSRVDIRHPQAEALRRLFGTLSIGVEVSPGASPGLSAAISTPRGKVMLGPADPPPRRWRD